MAKMVADAALAGMTRRAHEILSGRGMAAAKGGSALVPGQPPRKTAPTDMYRQMVDAQRSRSMDALQGLMGRSQGVNAALKINGFQAPGLGAIRQMAQLAAQKKQQDLGGLDKNPMYVTPEIANAASKYASGRSYGGRPYIPHQVVQEGVHVDPNTGQRYVMVKFVTATGGSSTERVNL